MKARIFWGMFFAMLLLCVASVGCADTDSDIVGVWKLTEFMNEEGQIRDYNREDYYLFDKDGTFFRVYINILNDSEYLGGHGKYSIEKNIIHFKWQWEFEDNTSIKSAFLHDERLCIVLEGITYRYSKYEQELPFIQPPKNFNVEPCAIEEFRDFLEKGYIPYLVIDDLGNYKDTMVKVSWKKVPEADYYSLFVTCKDPTDPTGEKSFWTIVNTALNRYFAIFFELEGQIMNFQLNGVDESGKKLPTCIVDSYVYICGCSKPNCVQAEKSIQLTWKCDTKFSDEEIEYTIYRKTENDKEFTKIGTSSKKSYTDTDVGEGKTYCYRVVTELKGILCGDHRRSNPSLESDPIRFVDPSKEPEYSIKIGVSSKKAGQAFADSSSGTKGTKITLTAKPNDGYWFKEWKVISGGVSVKKNQFKLGKANVNIQAVFSKVKDTITTGNLKYRLNHKTLTAIVTGPEKKTIRTITIPAAVKANGKSYRVTKIQASAFEGLTKLTKLTIGKNIKSIGKNAFRDDGNLKKIVIKTVNLTENAIGTNAFKGILKKVNISCPSIVMEQYQNLLPVKGVPEEARYSGYDFQ